MERWRRKGGGRVEEADIPFHTLEKEWVKERRKGRTIDDTIQILILRNISGGKKFQKGEGEKKEQLTPVYMLHCYMMTAINRNTLEKEKKREKKGKKEKR